MAWMRMVMARLRGLVGGKAANRDFDDEITSHLEEAAEEYATRGLSAEDARLAAMRDFGGVTQTQQVHREMRSLPWVEDAAQDIHYGWRRLRQDRFGTAIVLLTLAVAIGFSTALFSVIDATILRPLPYPHPEQLVDVSVEVEEPDGRSYQPTPSMADLRLWQNAGDVFTAVAGSGGAYLGRIVDGPQPQRLRVRHFTESYLSLHGVTPLLGRDFVRQDLAPGAPLVALLGYGYWQSEYGGRPDVLEQTIRLDDDVATIIGVLPDWFESGTPVVIPLHVPRQQFGARGTGRITVHARLQPGITIQQARERLSARMPDMRWRDGKQTDVRVVVESRLEKATSGNLTTVAVLAGAVTLILLIACVNVAAVLLARGAGRESELALRASLGAGRGRLIRQLLTESVLLAIGGGVLGVVLAWISLDALVANMPLQLPANSPIELNLTVLAWTAALLAPTVVVFGLPPAIRLSRVRIPPLLARARHLGSPFTRRSGQLLIAAETALALVLLAAAGLMLRSFARISAVDLGFNSDGVTTMQVLPLDRDLARHKDYYLELLQRIRTTAGISSAGLVDNFAFTGTRYTTIVADGTNTFSSVFSITPGYLDTLGARLRSGRLLTDADYASGARYVVVNQAAARAMFGEEPAVGRGLNMAKSDEPPWTVIGVIDDIRHHGPIDDRRKAEPQLFFPFQDGMDRIKAMTIVMRTDGGVPGLTARLRELAQGAGARVLIENVRTANDYLADRVITPRRRTVLLTLLGLVGLTLALVGIFGMTAYSVVRRTPEIGVRMAFGARPAQVIRAMVLEATVPITIGTFAGIGASLLVTPTIKSFLFETAPAEPATMISVALLLASAGCLAALASARRAAAIDPATSLRAE